MDDEQIQREMWETFARLVPDSARRRDAALQMIAKTTRADPRAQRAGTILATASTEQIDAAFERATPRGRTIPAGATRGGAPNSSSVSRRVTDAARGAVASLEELLEQITSVFAAPLTMATARAVRGGPRRGPGDEPEGEEESHDSFSISVPKQLTDLGVGAFGIARLQEGTLQVRLRRPAGTTPPSIVAIAFADGTASDPVVLTVTAAALTAELAWEHPDPPQELLLGVGPK